jgi:hypothetical protein
MIPGRPVYSGQRPDNGVLGSITPDDPLNVPCMVPEHTLSALQGKGYLRKGAVRTTERQNSIRRLDQDRFRA